MKKREIYSCPKVAVVRIEMEALLTSFSSGGTIEGPVGVKRHDPEPDDIDWDMMESVKEEHHLKLKSIWEDDIEIE